ncbi:MAG: hypothetical protein R3E78_02440 [Burkholderiaceae bacterium]
MIKRLQAKLKVRGALDTYRHALKATEQQGKGESALYLLSLDPAAKQLTVTAFGTGRLQRLLMRMPKQSGNWRSRGGAGRSGGLPFASGAAEGISTTSWTRELFLSQLDRALRRLEAATAWPRIAHPVPGKGSLVQGELW